MLYDAEKALRVCAGREPFHFTLDRQRQYIFLSQRQRPQNDDGERDDGAHQQRPHENTALRKKSGNGLENVEHELHQTQAWNQL